MGTANSKAAEEAPTVAVAPIIMALPVVNEIFVPPHDDQDEAKDDDDPLSVELIPPLPKKQRIEPPLVEPLSLSPSASFATTDSMTSTGLITLNVRGNKMDVPRQTLLEIPWFEALLTRWSHDGDDLTRDKEGNLYIDDDPMLFRSLIHHARNVSRPSPLALTLTTPSFADEIKEQEFRLMVDQYGLTDVFYSFAWYQAEWVCTEQAARCEITSCLGHDTRLVLPYSIEPWVNDKPHVIKSGNKHNRRILAFELKIGDATKLDWLDFGWMSKETRKAYKVRLNSPKVNPENGRRSIMYTCMEEDLNSVGETRMDKDSISIDLPEDAGSTLMFRLERERMKFSFHGNLFWSAGDTPANDLVPWIYHCGEEGSAIEITKIELEN